MSIEWGVVITSGVVSAVVGGGVSFVTARYVGEREEQGKSRAAARRAVSDAVTPALRKVQKYRFRSLSSFGRDPDGQSMHMDDVHLCAEILSTSVDLGVIRRWLVRRRLKRLFGKGTLRACEVHGFEAANALSATAVALFGPFQAAKYPGEDLPQLDRGLFDAALRKPPPDEKVKDLIQELEKLARCR